MNKILWMLVLGMWGMSFSAGAFDFSSIDPRMATNRNSEAVEENEEAPKQSSVFKNPNAVPSLEERPEPKPVPMRSSMVKIVAVVNGDIISTEDIDNRVKAFLMTSQIPMNEETKNMIYQKVLTATIDEKLKLQEAEKNDIKISTKDVDAAIFAFEEANKVEKGKIGGFLRKQGISERAFREQMRSDISWVRLVRQKSRIGNEITQRDIDREMNAAKADFSAPKFLILEIMIKKANAKNMDSLMEALRSDPRFEMYAFRFSESPTAANGGKLGWINKESLPEPLEKAVSNLRPGQISEPIQVGEDFYIIKVEQAFDPAKDNVALPKEADIKRFLENQRTDAFATQYIQELRQKAVIEFRN